MVSAGHSGRGVSDSAALPSSSQTASARRAHPLRDAQRAELAAVAHRDRDPVVLPGLDLAVRPDHDVGLGASWTKASSAGPGPIRPAHRVRPLEPSVSGRGSSCIHAPVT